MEVVIYSDNGSGPRNQEVVQVPATAASNVRRCSISHGFEERREIT